MGIRWVGGLVCMGVKQSESTWLVGATNPKCSGAFSASNPNQPHSQSTVTPVNEPTNQPIAPTPDPPFPFTHTNPPPLPFTHSLTRPGASPRG
jgi:hypothetical protein